MPDDLAEECRKRLPEDMLAVLDRFNKQKAAMGKPGLPRDMFLDGNEKIEVAIAVYHAKSTRENLAAVLDVIRQRMHEDGHFIFPISVDEDDENSFSFRTVDIRDGKVWHAAFTSQAEYEKGEESRVISNFIDSTLKLLLESEADGFIINPWGLSFLLSKELADMIIKADDGVE